MKTIMVGGFFDEEKGRPSGYITKLHSELEKNGMHISLVNGGTYLQLAEVYNTLHHYDIIFWLIDVDNALEKYLNEIKKSHPKAYLISSKFNQGRYSTLQLMQRALNAKANLLIEFNKDKNKVLASVYDPLCNAYCINESNVPHVASTIYNRLMLITQLKRVSSVRIDGIANIPNNEAFFSIVRNHSKQFSELIQGINPDRFLGNCSFRCESGFPSFKHNNMIYVSKRNCNKDTINLQGFVAVDLNKSTSDMICYYGIDKPSVDTPIQVELYKQLQPFNINYMLHSHAYIKDAPFTEHKLPCGALEEVNEIMKLIYDQEIISSENCFCINLLGHGSIVLASKITQLENIEFYSRNQPEM